jgi:hypothetical protein
MLAEQLADVAAVRDLEARVSKRRDRLHRVPTIRK